MDILKTAITSAGSVIYLFILAKIMGKRQISEMNLFDYIVGITVGSIAAELATYEIRDVMIPITAIFVYAAFSVLTSYLNNKSAGFRAFFNGKPTVLFDSGSFKYSELAKKRIDIEEFMCQARNQGYFDLSDIKTAVLENNGKISFLTYAASSPATCLDVKAAGKPKDYCINIIIDGKLMQDNLKAAGINEESVKKELNNRKLNLSDIMLAFCDSSRKITFFPKDKSNR